MDALNVLRQSALGLQLDAAGTLSTQQQLLRGIEATITRSCGLASFNAVLEVLQGTTSHGSGCTAVWTAGSIAYRCKTCQLTASSAVCVACFKAGNHEGHDYIVYRSPAGGCCDCGDTGSWTLEGCCPRHRPGMTQESDLSQVVGQAGADALTEAAVLVMANIVHHLTRLMEPGQSALSRTAHSEAAGALSIWLAKMVSCPQLRVRLCATATQSLTDVLDRPTPRTTDAAVLDMHKEVVVETEAILSTANTCPTPTTGQDCFARRLVCYMEHMPEATLTHVTTLLMLLLYDPPFKNQAAIHFFDFYLSMLRSVVANALRQPHTGTSSSNRGLGTALDRITVQLLNSEEVTRRLVEENNAFQVVFQALHHLMDKVMTIMSTSRDGDQEAAQTALTALFGGYRRVLGDLHTMAHYPSVAYTLLTDPSLMPDHLLLFLTKMQGMASQTCIPPGNPAAREPHAFVAAASNLELITAHAISEVVATCVGGTQQTRPHARQLEMLTTGARSCLEHLIDWASQKPLVAQPEGWHLYPPGLDVRYLYQRLRAGMQSVSPHLPLHRTAAAFIQALLACEGGAYSGDPEGSSRSLAGLLRQLAAPCSPPQPGLAGPSQPSPAPVPLGGLVSCGQAAVRHVLMLQAMLSQISQRIWVRNGDDAIHVELAYVMWRDHFQDLDQLMMMVVLTAGPQSAVMVDMLYAMGAGPLLQAAGVSPALPTMPPAEPQTAPPPSVGIVSASGELKDLVAAEDAVRLLVILLRNRVVCGTHANQRMRQVLLHSLALSDMGHAQLVECLPTDLQQQTAEVDTVLSELATYRPPSLSASGQYSLRKEAWAEFDPHMHHLTRKTLPRALERAAAAGLWKPRWQLRPPLYPLPRSLRSMMHVLEQPQLVKLVTYIVQHHVSGGVPRLSDELAISALNLIALQLQHAEALLHAIQALRVSAGPQAGGGEQQQAAEQAVGVLASMLLGSAGRDNAQPTPGLLRSLQQLAGGAADFGQDLVDCAQHLVEEAQRVLARLRSEGLMPETLRRVEEASASTSSAMAVPKGAGTVSGQGAAEETPPADDARARARQRQQALMATMKAAQAAFAQSSGKASGGGSVPGGASLANAAESDDSSEDEEQQVGTAGRAIGLRAEPGEEGEEEEDRESEQQEAVEEEEDDEAYESAGEGYMEEGMEEGMDMDEEYSEPPAGTTSGNTGPSVAARVPLPARKPAMGTWGPVHGQCVLCQSSSTSGKLGPLGWVGHVGICACLSVPLMPDRQPADSAAAAVAVGPSAAELAAELAAAGLQPGRSTEGLQGTEGLQEGLLQGAGGAAAQGAGVASGPALPTEQQAGSTAASSGSTQAASSEPPRLRTGAGLQAAAAGQAAGSAQMGDELVQQRLRRHGPALSIADYQPGCHVHSCGHMMHMKCFVGYRQNLVSAAEVDPLFPGYHMLSIARREFTCPLCRRLSNCILPAARFTWRPAATSLFTSHSHNPSHHTQVEDAQGEGSDVSAAHVQAKAARTSMLGGRRSLPARPVDSTPIPATQPGMSGPMEWDAVQHEPGHSPDVLTPAPGLLQGARLLVAGLPMATTTTSIGDRAEMHPQSTLAGSNAPSSRPTASTAAAGSGCKPSGAESSGATTATAAASQRLWPPQPNGSLKQAGAPSRTWTSVAGDSFSDLAQVALDLTKQVSIEVVKHTSCVERAIEARALLTARALAAATSHALTQPPPPNAQQPPQTTQPPQPPTQQGAGAQEAGMEAADTIHTGTGDQAGRATQPRARATPTLPATQAIGTTPAAAMGIVGRGLLAAGLAAPTAAGSAVGPNLMTPGIATRNTTTDHVSQPALPPPVDMTPYLEPQADLDGPAGGALHVPLGQRATEVPVARGPTTGTGTEAPVGHAAAATAAAGGPQHASASVQLPQSAAAVAGTGVEGAVWKPGMYGETVGEVRRRWHHEPLAPALWALLAHNLAHWEALRRPVVLPTGGSPLTAPPSPSPPSSSRLRTVPVPHAAATAAAPFNNIHRSPATTIMPVSSTPGRSQADQVLAAAPRHCRTSLLPVSGLRGQEVVEGAHMTALQSVLQLCLALGMGGGDGLTAAYQLHTALAWLLGSDGDAVAGTGGGMLLSTAQATVVGAAGSEAGQMPLAGAAAEAAAEAVVTPAATQRPTVPIPSQGLSAGTAPTGSLTPVQGRASYTEPMQHLVSHRPDSGHRQASTHQGAHTPCPRAPLCISAGFLTEYDAWISQGVLRAFFDKHQPQPTGGLRVLCSRQATDLSHLLADPLLLTLELLALALTAHGTPATTTNRQPPVPTVSGEPQPSSLFTGPSSAPPSSYLQHGLGLSAPPAGVLPLEPCGLLRTPATLLSGILQVVLPITAVQTAAWLLTGSQSADTQQPVHPTALSWQAHVMQCLQQMTGEGQGAVQSQESVAAHLLPLLVRCYLLHCLLQHQRPAPDDPLLQAYASLYLEDDKQHDTGHHSKQHGSEQQDQHSGVHSGGRQSMELGSPRQPDPLQTQQQTQVQAHLQAPLLTGFLSHAWGSLQGALRHSQPGGAAVDSQARAGDAVGAGTAGTGQETAGPCLELADHLCANMGVQGIGQAIGEAFLHLTTGRQWELAVQLQPERARTSSIAANDEPLHMAPGPDHNQAAQSTPEALQRQDDSQAQATQQTGQSHESVSATNAAPAVQHAQASAGGMDTGCAGPWNGHLLMRWAGHMAWAAGVPLDGVPPRSAELPPGWLHGAAAGAANGTEARGGGSEGPSTASAVPMHAGPMKQQPPCVLGPLAVLRPAPTLIELPRTFQDLFQNLADKPCYLCGKVSDQPSLCLVTGRLLCSWWRGCHSSHGGGLLHAMEACAGNTLMLSLKSTKVMALRPNRLAICQSPYLDSHGEEDTDLRRGRPLYLNAQVYGQLNSLWAASATEFDSHMLQSSRVDLVFL